MNEVQTEENVYHSRDYWIGFPPTFHPPTERNS